MAEFSKTFCTTREAALLLGVSVTTIQNWTESGLLESWKTEGGHRRIIRSSIDRLISEPRTHRALPGCGPHASPEERRLRILIIEGDEFLRHLYQTRMSNWSFSPAVDVAPDGFGALVKIGIRCPDLLITDLNMPHINGFDMLNTLAAMPWCRRMQLIAVSSMSPAEIKQAGQLPEGILILGKPLAFNQLEEIAKQLAGQKTPFPAESR